MIVSVFSCSACVSGRKEKTPCWCPFVFGGPSVSHFEQGRVVWLGKALTRKSRGELGVGNGNPHLMVRVREGWCGVARWSQGEQKTTDTKTHPTMSVFSCSIRSRTFHCPTYSWRIPGSSGPIRGFLVYSWFYTRIPCTFLVHSWYLPTRIPGAFLVHSWYFLPGFLVHSGAFLVHSWYISSAFLVYSWYLLPGFLDSDDSCCTVIFQFIWLLW